MLDIKEAIIVEGNYDKMKLKEIVNAVIICTNGFSVFKDKKMKNYIKTLAEKQGIIILTDSDQAGINIRNHIKTFTSSNNIKNIYIPKIKGKEKRKTAPSKEGLIGVEGMEKELLINLLKNFSSQDKAAPFLDKMKLYEDGFYGKKSSQYLRQRFLTKLSLPENLSVNSFLDVINKVLNYEEYNAILAQITSEEIIETTY